MDTTFTLDAGMLLLVGVTAAIIQVLRNIEFVERYKQWLPFVAIAIAALLNYAQQYWLWLVPSVVIGLTAAGAYDAVRKKSPAEPVIDMTDYLKNKSGIIRTAPPGTKAPEAP